MVGAVIDLHCHVLPGIDDGPATIEGSLALASAAAEAGTRVLVATPHVSRRYPNEPATIARLVGEVNERVAQAGLPIEVRAGAEIATSRAAALAPGELSRLRLGDGHWLLIEPSFTRGLSELDALVRALHADGHGVVLAHPERCMAFHRDPLTLQSLVSRGALASITAGSLVGRFGEHVRRFALRLVRDGLVHNVASDAHDRERRPPGALEEIAQAGLQPLAAWLTEEVPAAILAGAEIPQRPRAALAGTARRWWRRRAKLA